MDHIGTEVDEKESPQFYATVIGGLLRRAAILYDVGIKQKAGA